LYETGLQDKHSYSYAPCIKQRYNYNWYFS